MSQTMSSLGFSQSQCQDGSKCTWILVGETPVKENEEGARRDWESHETAKLRLTLN